MIDIVKSWAAAMNPTEEQLTKATERLAICETCEHKKDDPFKHCGVCGCPLKGKVFSERGCPEGKW
jgi:uncharacterized paraquat-inducible protein A